MDGIAVQEEPPLIQTPCIYCFHCVMQCPEVAIVADWDSLMSLVPEIFDRYFNNLDAAEKRGEFRRLTAREAINLANPIYKQREREWAAREGKK